MFFYISTSINTKAGASRQGGVEANASTLGLGGRNFYILEGGFGTQGGGQGGCLHLTGGGMDAPDQKNTEILL